ncbi:MAG: hypothetical protein HFJ52_03145 [Clostridia bacterium]|nr:hypothetical protein [Clostridia bacterium]
MQNKEIEEAKKTLYPLSIGDFVTWFTTDGAVQVELSVQTLLQYIDQLENKVKELGKGQHTLMQSRRKWKNRYYKEKRKNVNITN